MTTPVVVDKSLTPFTVGVYTLTKSLLVSGSNTILFVVVTRNGGGVQSIQYNGASLTLWNSLTGDSGYHDTYFLKNPSAGTHDLVVTLDSSKGNLGLSAITLQNVDQTTPLSGYVNYVETGTPPINVSFSLDVMSASGELVVDYLRLGTNRTMTQGGSQTLIGSTPAPTGSVAMSSQPGVATTTMAWTLDTVSQYVQIGFSVKGSTDTSPTSSQIVGGSEGAFSHPFGNPYIEGQD